MKIDDWIVAQGDYESSKHKNITNFRKTQYQTICTYIRNEIDHPPKDGVTFGEAQLRTSIELLRRLVHGVTAKSNAH